MAPSSAFDPASSPHQGDVVRSLRTRIAERVAAGRDTGELRLGLGRALLADGRHAEAAIELESLLTSHVGDAGLTVKARATLAGALVLTGRAEEGEKTARAVLESPGRDVESEVLARSALRGLEFFAGRYERALEQARQIVEVSANGGPIARSEARLDLGGMLMLVDEFDQAEQWLTLADDAPTSAHEEAQELLARICLFRGSFEAVLACIAPRGVPPREADASEVSRVMRPTLRAHALIHLDRIERARRELATVVGASPPMVLIASAILAEADGDLSAAAADAERALGRASEPRFSPELTWWVVDIVRLVLAAGDAETARWAVDRVGSAAAATNAPSVLGAFLTVRGMVERDPDLLMRAIRLYQSSPRRVAHAQATEALADVYVQRGDPESAVESLFVTLRLWQRLEALRDERRVIHALAGLGIRTRPVARTTERMGWRALSATESTVAALLAEGMTNAQIADRLVISRRTAENHVAHILAKLDVPTRSAAARVVIEMRDRPVRQR